MTMTDEQLEIWELIRQGNRAWMAGAVHQISDLFDEKAVIVAPGAQGRVEGREAIVKSYEDYIHHARTHAFEEQEHAIDVFGDTAVVTYRFEVRYTLEGEDEERDEAGQEVLVLRRGAGGWKVIWRTQALGS
jgi:uncharacterized protein (TIGR02246 family)